jgi:2',3'-cyclic-nucleotide 2'-phosphodiesterase/3'-nucleotidase
METLVILKRMRQSRVWSLLAFLTCSFSPLNAAHIKLTVLATTDLHGNIYPVDYYLDSPSNRGLAKIAALIRSERAANPNNLLIDCGDTIQGTPLEYVYQTFVRTGHLPLKLAFPGAPFEHDPMMLAMNAIGYDAMVVGNHEFNYGLKNLDRARADARFPWLSANTEFASKTGEPFPHYLLKTVAGVKVAVIGITTPGIPSWEEPDNYDRYRFVPSRSAVEKTVAELHALPADRRPDLVLVAAHAGLGRNPKTGSSGPDENQNDNQVYEIAAGVRGIDAIVFGHTHQEMAQLRVNGVLLTQPKNWGMSLAKLDFELESKPGGGWTVVEKNSRLIPVTAQTAVDEEMLRIARPYHEMTEKYLKTEVAHSNSALDAKLGRVEDTALIDAIQTVQLYYAKADVSFASLFNSRVSVPSGPVTVRQIASLYLYDNELYALEGNGKMVKDALENAVRYYLSCSGDTCSKGPLINSHVIGFNCDMAAGVDYEVDLTRPEGQRIRNLSWRGKPLEPNQKLRLAVNNYRAGGSAGYAMFRNAKIVWRSSQDIRQLIIDYYIERGELPAKPVGNWRILPAEALRTLEREASREAPVFK